MVIDYLARGHPAYPVQQPSSSRFTDRELVLTGAVTGFGESRDARITVGLREISYLKTQVVALPQKGSEKEAGLPPTEVACVWMGTPDTGMLTACWYIRTGTSALVAARGLERAIRIEVGSSGAPGLYMDN